MNIEKALMKVITHSKENLSDIAKRADVDVYQLCRFLNHNEKALNQFEVKRLSDVLNTEDREKWLLLIR